MKSRSIIPWDQVSFLPKRQQKKIIDTISSPICILDESRLSPPVQSICFPFSFPPSTCHNKALRFFCLCHADVVKAQALDGDRDGNDDMWYPKTSFRQKWRGCQAANVRWWFFLPAAPYFLRNFICQSNEETPSLSPAAHRRSNYSRLG